MLRDLLFNDNISANISFHYVENFQEKEVKDAFCFYETDKSGSINRTQLRSILGNFAFTSMNVKEIEEEIRKDYNQTKTSFNLEEVMNIISKKWFLNGGREQEANEIFKLFDRK